MGIVAGYARMHADGLEELLANPDSYWDKQDSWASVADPGAADFQYLYIDKEWRTLSWLCSEAGRAEERNQAIFMRVMNRKYGGEDLSEDGKFQAALAGEAGAMGFTYISPEDLPKDLVLEAIQGRRQDSDGAIIEGLGIVACVWRPDEVHVLADALNEISEVEMRERFDVEEMEVLDLPGDWEQSELDEFILPQFRRLRAFYERAASESQHVVVVMS